MLVQQLQKPDMLYGRLIARILPVGITADYEQTSKPLLRMIDPSTLSPPGISCANYDPWTVTTATAATAATMDPTTAETSLSLSRYFPFAISKSETMDHHPQDGKRSGCSIEAPDQQQQQQQHVTLDMYLFDNRQQLADAATTPSPSTSTTSMSSTASPTTTHIRMNRLANDEVSNTLKRMEVSLFKKLKSIANRNSSANYNNHNNSNNDMKKNNNHKQTSNAAQTTKGANASLRKDHKQQRQSTSSSLFRWSNRNGIVPPSSHASFKPHQLLDYLEPWDISSSSSSSSGSSPLTNYQVWGQTEYPLLAVAIDIITGVTTHPSSETKETISIPFLVEQNPPSIIGVKTFEGFCGHVYTQVPVVIQVDAIHATHVRIDWYMDGVLTCQDSPSFLPKEEHVGKYVSVLITPMYHDPQGRQHDGSGCQEAYRFERPVEAVPLNIVHSIRPAWTAPRDNYNNSSGDALPPPQQPQQMLLQCLRVVSYNILADQNAFSGENQTPFYPYVEASTLLRARRMPLILHELLSYQADIICLQEVDEFVYEALFRPVLDQMGYQGFFSVKQSGGTQEGCAMFWSLNMFERVGEDDDDGGEKMHTHVIRDLLSKSHSTTDAWTSLDDIQLLLERSSDLKKIIDNKLGHVLQTACLTLKKLVHGNAPKHLLVANTHLFYHPLADHIRLMQSFAILHQLDIEQRQNNTHDDDDDDDDGGCPILFCGDMNTSPTNCAVRLILDRHVPKNYNRLQQHLNSFSWGKSDNNNNNNNSSHGSNGNSPRQDNNDDKDENSFPALNIPDHFPQMITAYGDDPPDFTHYIDCFHGCLDHMFVSLPLASSSKNQWGLKPIAMAPMPTVADVTRHVAMPSEFLPSDHVSLVCDFEFTMVKE